MLVVCNDNFGTCGHEGSRETACPQTGFFAAVTRARRGEPFPRTEEARPACVDSHTALWAAAKLLSSPYSTTAQRD